MKKKIVSPLEELTLGLKRRQIPKHGKTEKAMKRAMLVAITK